MKILLKNLNGLPGPTRALPSAPAAPRPRPTRLDSLEQLKLQLLARALQSTTDPIENLLARRAANEATSLAWTSPYPLLVFPALFEEKLREARRMQAFQETVRRRSRELAFAE